MHAFDFAGHMLCARADASLYWPARRALLVADLHLEKASWLAGGGQMLPPYDSADTLRRLQAAVNATGAEEVWALGDSFHDPSAPERLSAEDRYALTQLAANVALHWVEGNHDRATDSSMLPGQWHDEIAIDGVHLRHIGGGTGPEISGHYHPKMRITAAGRSQSRRCFLYGHDDRLILPAFGALTGGIFCTDPALDSFRPAQALIATARQLHRFAV